METTGATVAGARVLVAACAAAEQHSITIFIYSLFITSAQLFIY
jgi:hypothetical protein